MKQLVRLMGVLFTFAALGTEVWIVDGRGELLPFLDREVSKALEESMHRQLGIEFLWKNRVTHCEAHEYGDITLEFDTGGRLCVDAVLVTAGRASNTAALNLSAAGLEPGPYETAAFSFDEPMRAAAPPDSTPWVM